MMYASGSSTPLLYLFSRDAAIEIHPFGIRSARRHRFPWSAAEVSALRGELFFHFGETQAPGERADNREEPSATEFAGIRLRFPQ
jgi:hypothetical protein